MNLCQANVYVKVRETKTAMGCFYLFNQGFNLWALVFFLLSP